MLRRKKVGTGNSWNDADVYLPSDELLAEHAYLVARGVRALALAGHCPSEHALRAATRVEHVSVPGVTAFVLDHRDGTASFGYTAERWPLDLYEWAILERSVPQEQRDRIIGLLLGYTAPAVARYEADGSGRRFTLSREPASSLPLGGSASTGGTSLPCSGRSA